eukprot:m.97279 g.97279  ORF g.97279 m.97279 type:complete len:58 (-) comp14822_c0_seq9:95-268(-)
MVSGRNATSLLDESTCYCLHLAYESIILLVRQKSDLPTKVPSAINADASYHISSHLT